MKCFLAVVGSWAVVVSPRVGALLIAFACEAFQRVFCGTLSHENFEFRVK